MPKLTPLESANDTEPELAVCEPATSALGAVLCEYEADAVIVFALNPN
jgi:hypothetical protein